MLVFNINQYVCKMQNTEVMRVSLQHLMHTYSGLGLSADGGGLEKEAA